MAYTLKPEEVGVLPSVVWEKSGKTHTELNTKTRLIIVDAGIKFPEDDLLGIDYCYP